MDAEDGGADIGHMTNAWPLSPAQARFADANETHHYCSALPDDGCVYMYATAKSGRNVGSSRPTAPNSNGNA